MEEIVRCCRYFTDGVLEQAMEMPRETLIRGVYEECRIVRLVERPAVHEHSEQSAPSAIVPLVVIKPALLFERPAREQALDARAWMHSPANDARKNPDELLALACAEYTVLDQVAVRVQVFSGPIGQVLPKCQVNA